MSEDRYYPARIVGSSPHDEGDDVVPDDGTRLTGFAAQVYRQVAGERAQAGHFTLYDSLIVMGAMAPNDFRFLASVDPS